MKAQKLFRYIWRINAVVILLVTLGIGAVVAFTLWSEARRPINRSTPPSAPVASADPRLRFGEAIAAPGTSVLRIELRRKGNDERFSLGSGGDYGSELANVLFIDPGEKIGRWLLPNNGQTITEKTADIEGASCGQNKTAAIAALAKPWKAPDGTGGTLLLFDPSGRKIVKIADGATEIRLAATAGNEIMLLYERENHLVRTTLDSSSFAKKDEQLIEIPAIR